MHCVVMPKILVNTGNANPKYFHDFSSKSVHINADHRRRRVLETRFTDGKKDAHEFWRPFPRPGLSNSWKLPCWKIFGWTFAFWEISRIVSTIRKIRDLGISKIDENYLAIYFGYTLRLKQLHAISLINDSDLWEKTYLPIEVEDKTILDVGSGCGETMAFFFAHGAKKVVGIESDPEACMFARTNIWENRWNAEIKNEAFAVRHLSIPHDFLKVNAEGAEQILLGYDGKLGACTIRVAEFESFDLPKMFQYHFPDLEPVHQSESGAIVLNGFNSYRPYLSIRGVEADHKKGVSNSEIGCAQ
jgi:hypothetical protein